MTYYNTILTKFLEKLKILPSFPYIITVLLGGSHAIGKSDKLSDIDILIICSDMTSSILYKELQSSINSDDFKKNLDVKIIEKESIRFVNNSIHSLFFYHLVKHSKILCGEDLRNNFKLNPSLCYQAIQQKTDKLEKIKILTFEYNQLEQAEMLLFTIAKSFLIIHQLFSTKIDSDQKYNDNFLIDTFGNRIEQIRRTIKNQRKWISIYDKKGKEEEFGFNLVKLKRRKSTQKDEQHQKLILTSIQKITDFGTKCLELLYQ